MGVQKNTRKFAQVKRIIGKRYAPIETHMRPPADHVQANAMPDCMRQCAPPPFTLHDTDTHMQKEEPNGRRDRS